MSVENIVRRSLAAIETRIRLVGERRSLARVNTTIVSKLVIRPRPNTIVTNQPWIGRYLSEKRRINGAYVLTIDTVEVDIEADVVTPTPADTSVSVICGNDMA